jgi:dynein heavy chain
LINTKKPKELKPLLFSLAFFHAVILERRKFGALGWNIPYEWMNSDFDASKLHLMRYLDEYHEIPINILNFLIGTINYGGRVTDDKDGKLITAILAKYFNHNIFQEAYSFSEDGKYYIPKYDSISDLQDYLEHMPLDDGPDIFGLHANANITLQKNLVLQFMEPLISIQPRTASSLSKKPDQIVLDMKRFIENKFVTVSELDLSKDSSSIYIKDPNNPNLKKRSSLGNFLLQESEKFNNLLKIIKSTLTNLELAVKGLLVMSPDLELVYFSFIDGKVPLKWETAAYLSLKPLASWVVDLVERFNFMREWLEVGQIKSYWVSAFFFPQGKYKHKIYYLT